MINITESKGAGKVFDFFSEISKIPRGSGNTKGIADYLVSFAKARSLDFVRDEADNVIIKKKATSGYESRPAVIFQGHTDMVLNKAEGVSYDMEKEGVKLIVDGDLIRADGTTLGADNGIAVAYALAILDSDDIPHPDFEAVFTSDEEIGLIGATALDCSSLKGRLMINLDSDAEGIFTAGCAGGRRVDISLPLEYEAVRAKKYTLIIDGLKGGHSGVEINKGRTNAVKRIADYLYAFGDTRLVSLDGGVADNAIPSSAVAEFVSEHSLAELSDIADKLKATLPSGAEHESITLATSGEADTALTVKSSKNLVSLIRALPTGVVNMSRDIEGQVETSLNLGIISLNDSASLSFSLRSSKDAEKEELANRVKKIAAGYGAEISEHGDYPGWEYKKDSYLRDTMCRVYKEMYGKDAEVITIHAGLECGIFSDKIEGLDCISMGPDAYDIHTPSERLSVSSTVRVWEYLLEVLKNI
ncbi:MAG: aminoacyl-histidine dipeptidase [Clostridia bacterium]|nr:aminoacyl-histidine dipeptidase [Clostridia bacterium]